MIPEIKTIVVGMGVDQNYLCLYSLRISADTYKLEVKASKKLKKETNSKVLEIHYDAHRHLLSCFSSSEKGQSSQKIEMFSVLVDNEEALVKKLTRIEKRKKLKRAKNFSDSKPEDLEKDEEEVKENPDSDLPVQLKVDKKEMKEKIKKGDYDFNIHFSKVASIDLEA